MGQTAQYEGALLDGFQQQQCCPRSALEIWRSPAASAAAPLESGVILHSDSLAFAPTQLLTNDNSNVGEEWNSVRGLEFAQVQALQNVASRGVFWSHPTRCITAVFTLHHGGDVEADGNCLFTASQKAMQLQLSPLEVRLRAVRRFAEDYRSGVYSHQVVNDMIRHLYSPDLSTGWGVHVVQEVKLLAKKGDREALDTAIGELVTVGVSREAAAESVYKEHCIMVDDGESWAKYMSTAGGYGEDFDIITLQYTEEGLMSVEENREGRAAAFGDDIAIECLANEFEREIFVVQAHGADAMLDSDHCLFFLPHSPRHQSSIQYPPMFLFMKGTGWCGAGADHYEPIIARVSSSLSREKAAIAL